MTNSKKLILKTGEGLNNHTLESVKPFQFEPLQDHKDAFRLLVTSTGKLTHAEHGQINIAPGNKISCTQVEFDPLSNVIRQVFD